MEDNEADEAGEYYGGGLAEDEVDPFTVGSYLQPPQREHFS